MQAFRADRRQVVGALGAGALAAALPGARASAAAPSIQVYTTPTPGSGPYILASGPDGQVWFCENRTGKIGRLDPASGRIAEFALDDSDAQCVGIAAGADAALWFMEGKTNRVGRITVSGQIREFPVPTPKAGPNGTVLGPDGAIWFSEYDAGRIGRVTPDGVISDIAVLPRGARPLGPAATAAHVWFSDPVNNLIYRVGLNGQVSAFPAASPGAPGAPRPMIAGPDGAVWFALSDGGALGRITVDGQVTHFPLARPDAAPRGLVFVGDELWFSQNKLSSLGRMTLKGRFLADLALPSVASGPRALLRHTDGRVYVSLYDQGAIARISV